MILFCAWPLVIAGLYRYQVSTFCVRSILSFTIVRLAASLGQAPCVEIHCNLAEDTRRASSQLPACYCLPTRVCSALLPVQGDEATQQK